MSADNLTRAERRRQEKDLLRNVTRPDTAKGARKRRKISAAMEAAAEEAALKLRAEEVAEMTPRYRTESDAIMLADRAGPWVKIDDLLEACRRRVAAAAFLSHPVDTGQGVGEEEVKRMAGALANDAILGSVCSDGNSNVQDVALRLAAVAAQALAARLALGPRGDGRSTRARGHGLRAPGQGDARRREVPADPKGRPRRARRRTQGAAMNVCGTLAIGWFLSGGMPPPPEFAGPPPVAPQIVSVPCQIIPAICGRARAGCAFRRKNLIVIDSRVKGAWRDMLIRHEEGHLQLKEWHH